MPLHRLLPLAAATVCALLLTGCLDYEEEMWINGDLSGRAVVKVTLPDALSDKFASIQTDFSEAKLKERFAKAKGVTLVSYALNTDSRRPVAKIEVEFSSLEALSQAVAANPPAAALAGIFEVTKEGANLKITRRMGTVEPKIGLGEGDFAQYVTHFPVELKYTNSTRHDGAHDTVRYNYKLEDVFTQQPVMINTIPKQRDWKWLYISLGVITVASYIGWMVWGRRTK